MRSEDVLQGRLALARGGTLSTLGGAITGLRRHMRRYNLPERFDVNSAATVEQELLEIVEGEQVDQLVCDFSETVYISSAGLRVMLLVVKQLKKKSGSCLLSRMRPPVLHIFQSAGLDKIMDIETSAEPTP